MNNSNIFFWGFIFGAIGFGYLMYGIKQKKPIPLVCGALLSGVSYFVSNLVFMFILAGVFMALPFALKKVRG
ncbi:MAG: hypothetical protein ACE5DW_06430 [Thermodesulfobacteriota bacterium]